MRTMRTTAEELYGRQIWFARVHQTDPAAFLQWRRENGANDWPD